MLLLHHDIDIVAAGPKERSVEFNNLGAHALVHNGLQRMDADTDDGRGGRWVDAKTCQRSGAGRCGAVR